MCCAVQRTHAVPTAAQRSTQLTRCYVDRQVASSSNSCRQVSADKAAHVKACRREEDVAGDIEQHAAAGVFAFAGYLMALL